MSVLLLHGVPDTHRIWAPLRAELGRDDVLAPDLPGFGCPRPEGFEATRWDYRDWLIELLEGLDEPPDVVAHDIGSHILQGVLVERPELVRSFACGNSCHADYAWHWRARIWQTTRLGEGVRDGWEAMTPEQRRASLDDGLLPRERLDELAETIDWTMWDSILRFYRSSAWNGDWQLQPGDYPPALVLWGADDDLQGPEWGERLAEAIGARMFAFEGCGHWWPHERPAEAAAALREFWAGLEGQAEAATVSRPPWRIR